MAVVVSGTRLPGEIVAQFTVTGAPRSKKTHNQAFHDASGRIRVAPSKQWRAWKKTAFCIPRVILPDDGRYSVMALFYRDGDWGDSCGMYQGLADVLQGQVFKDDKCIKDWDGSRLLLDRTNPRTEVTIRIAEVL